MSEILNDKGHPGHGVEPVRQLQSICEHTGIYLTAIGELLGVSRVTVWRWHSGACQPTSTMRRRLFELDTLLQRLARHHSPEALRWWLYSPRQRLGKAPAELIKEDRIREVVALADEWCRGEWANG